MKNIFIIEHLEPRMYPWCLIEYKSISKIVGKNNLWFTNVKNNSFKLKNCGKVFQKSVKSMNLENACVLDPEASKVLTKKDKKFKYFILGGILGDNPPKKRTFAELTKFLPNTKKRNIGKSQFSTDNAVFVVNEILKGIPLKKMKFQDFNEIKINKIESVILPFKYPLTNGKPRISRELIKFIKTKERAN